MTSTILIDLQRKLLIRCSSFLIADQILSLYGNEVFNVGTFSGSNIKFTKTLNYSGTSSLEYMGYLQFENVTGAEYLKIIREAKKNEKNST